MLRSTAGKVTTSLGGDLILGAGITANASATTAGAGFVAEQFVPAPATSKLFTEDSVQTAAGSISATATLNAADGWIMGIAAFKAAH